MKRLERLRPILIVAGIGAVGYLIFRAGPAVTWNIFTDLSWRLPLILLLPTCVAVVADTLAWRYTFLTPPRSFARLLGVGSPETR